LTGSNGLKISIEDHHRPGRPSSLKTNDTIDLIRNKIRNDRRLTVREVANKLVYQLALVIQFYQMNWV